jgi:hypothetical protein
VTELRERPLDPLTLVREKLARAVGIHDPNRNRTSLGSGLALTHQRKT